MLAAERGKIIGLRLGHTLQAQQMLMWTDLNIALEERRNLSQLVQPGMRAVTVRAADSDLEKSFALIRPGDRVDVLLTLAGGAQVPGAPPTQRTAICPSAERAVLAVGRSDTGARSGGGRRRPGA